MNLTLLICGGIILIGFLIFLFLVFRARKKAEGIVHYEGIRDKLTLREKANEKIDDALGFSFVGSLNQIITGLVFLGLMLMVCTSVLSTLQDTLINETAVSNVTTTSGLLITQQTISFFPIVMVVMIVGMALIGVGRVFSSNGLL